MLVISGEYVVTIKFNDEHIPDSPFRVPVLPSSGDARNVTVEALKQKGLEVSLVRMDLCIMNPLFCLVMFRML